MHVIGAGLGRTGTYSLKFALNQLGLGPCHHMEEVLMNQPVQVPLWAAAVKGAPDWKAIYAGYGSAVDWPTAAFYRELYAAYPKAKFVLTVRSPETWVASFSQTIYPFLTGDVNVRAQMRAWSDMVTDVVVKTGFPAGLDEAGLRRAFEAHNAAVQALIPKSQLLVYQVKEGWAPLCEFLGVPVPDEPFPRSNDRSEFWDKVAPALA